LLFAAVLIADEFILPASPAVEYLVIDDTNLSDPLLASSRIDDNDPSRLAIPDTGLATG